jgi:chondroitin-sulfate-ABC endolyase/exolyase
MTGMSKWLPFCLFSLLVGLQCHAQGWELFEGPDIPAGWTLAGPDSTIAVVSSRSLQGERSLQWSWSDAATTLTWSPASAITGSGHQVFSQWVRLDEPLPGARLRVELRSTNGQTRWFEMGLDFTGWRTLFAPYSSMEGGGNNSINRIRWSLVGSPPTQGKLYLDQVIVGQTMDTRFQYADRQAPFIWKDRPKSHWENLVRWDRRQPDPVEPTPDELLGATHLRQYWDAKLIGSGTVNSSVVDQWATRIDDYRLRRIDGVVRGNQIYRQQYPANAYPPGLAATLLPQGLHDFQNFTTLMLDLARGWHQTNDPILRQRISEMVVLMAEHLLDQGWAEGSNQGALFLFGYQSREYMRAVYLARDIFAQAGILEPMTRAARWYGQTGMLLDHERAPNMDFFNTLLQGQLLSILLEPDESLQVAWLRAFSRSIADQISDLRPGDADGFKSDGTTFHHFGHYPAYGIGAISTLGDTFDALRETPFAFHEPARLSFRNVLLAAQIYSNPRDWPIGISGRHPFSGNINSSRQAFAALAQYADPAVGTPPDRALAGAYLQLWGAPGGRLGELFSSAGLSPRNPTGFFTFPFANHAVYRSGTWMVSLKGYSRHVWSSEIYTADNRYGRNQSNGTAEILLASGRTGSGFQPEGWDWNRLPGTTALHLPLDELDSPVPGTLMLRSNETMAGGASAGQEGIFGFILNEDRFGHLLQARKSAFAANNMVIFLGTGIGSTHQSAPIETTLFQVALGETRPPLILSRNPSSPISAFPWQWAETTTEPFWVIDPVGNGFWLPPGQEIKLSRLAQDSRNDKTRAPTTGDFATGWIHHGVNRQNATYHYVALPQASPSQMNHLSNRMASSEPAYFVLQQDDSLHAIHLTRPNRYGFAIFEPNQWPDLPHLIEADSQALLWLEDVQGDLILSAANPDLHPGQKESLIRPLTIRLRGLWNQATNTENAALLLHENGTTRITIPAREGATHRLRLSATTQPTPWAQNQGNELLDPVVGFRTTPSEGPRLQWTTSTGPGFGYVIERQLPGDSNFQPIAFLDNETTRFFDRQLPEESLAYYRVRRWGEDGLGPPSNSLLAHNRGHTEGLSYNFRTMTNRSELTADGWTSSGLHADEDWYLGPEGMFFIDNSPTSTPRLTVPLPSHQSGRVKARIGVARMANFLVRMELMAGTDSLALIELTTRTQGFLRGPTDVEFTDDRWDVELGTLRDVVISWREIPGTDRMEFTLRYLGHTEAVNQWEVERPAGTNPDRIRFSVGFDSAVNRGLVLESLEILARPDYSMLDFFQAWATTFLANTAADPAADFSGNGIPNLWEFLLRQNTMNPAQAYRMDLSPRLEILAGNPRFVWHVPELEGASIHLEGALNLSGPWATIPHQEEFISGSLDRLSIVSPVFTADTPAFFYRLVLGPDSR